MRCLSTVSSANAESSSYSVHFLVLVNAGEKTNMINLLCFSPSSTFGRSRLPQRMTPSSTQTRMPAATKVRLSVSMYGSSFEAWDMKTSHGSGSGSGFNSGRGGGAAGTIIRLARLIGIWNVLPVCLVAPLLRHVPAKGQRPVSICPGGLTARASR